MNKSIESLQTREIKLACRQKLIPTRNLKIVTHPSQRLLSESESKNNECVSTKLFMEAEEQTIKNTTSNLSLLLDRESVFKNETRTNQLLLRRLQSMLNSKQSYSSDLAVLDLKMIRSCLGNLQRFFCMDPHSMIVIEEMKEKTGELEQRS